ncbi:MAG: hypothetical protein EP319_01970 [Deltaproteobacteria bacterium]|nr:MAG: hypothetical protein EP319_01970 [Deltaproteobacteria bacterium]
MSFSNNKLYFCNQCKKILNNVEDLLFVEEDSSRGFCSEKCIENFYSPLFKHYEAKEKELRSELGIQNETCLKLLEKSELVDKLFSAPLEIYHSMNELEEEIYSFIGKFPQDKGKEIWLISLCYVYDAKPSFVFLLTATENEEFVDHFRIGDPVEDIEDFLATDEEMEVSGDPKQILETVEQKKSSLLAQMIEERSPHDIPIEEFANYEPFFEPTIENPDEVYTYMDEDGDTLYTYIKAYERDGCSFYFFVVCYNFSSNPNEQTESLLPIISFPSLDADTYKKHSKGERISGSLKS